MKRNSIIAAALAGTMLFSLVACAPTAPATGNTSSAAESTEEADDEANGTKEASVASDDSSEADGKTYGPAASTDQIIWKIAHNSAEDVVFHQELLKVAKRVSDATNGNWTIEIYPNSQLGSNTEVLEGMTFGTIDGTVPNVAQLSAYSSSVDVLQLPYLIYDPENFEGALKVYNSDVLKPIYDELEENGFIWEASWFQGNRELTTTKTPVHTPADMKGLKIRTMENEYHMAHFNALGANAIPMAFSEVFTALQQGAIDGQENPYINIYTQGMHEVQGYVIETAHIFDIIPLLISKASYDALPDDYREIFDEICKDSVPEEWEAGKEANEMYKQKIIENGHCEVIELTPEERQAFRDAAQPVYDSYIKAHGSELLDAIEEAQK